MMKNSMFTGSKLNNQALFKIAAGAGHSADQAASPTSKVLAGFVLEGQDAAQLQNKLTRLTSREIEVLQRIADGNANKETAWKLGIHIKTVQKHREHLMQKLDIHNTAGLTRYAICAGILEDSIQLTAF